MFCFVSFRIPIHFLQNCPPNMIKHAKFEGDQSHLMAITFEKNCTTIHQWWQYNDVTRTSCNLKPLTARILPCNNGNIKAPNYWPFRRESNPLVTGGFPWQRVSIAACPCHDVITGCTLVKSSVVLYSLSDKNYRKISWSLETTRLVVNMMACVGCGGVYGASEVIMKDVHHKNVKMGTMAYQLNSLAIVYSIVYSGADQRKH